MSAHRDAAGNVVPNTLADLTTSANRFAHSGVFPHDLVVSITNGESPYVSGGDESLLDDAEAFLFEHEQLVGVGDDGSTSYVWPDSMLPRFLKTDELDGTTHRWNDFIVLSDPIAFDVKAYDPDSVSYTLAANPSISLSPGDIQYQGEYNYARDTGADFDAPQWNFAGTAVGTSTGNYVDLGHLMTAPAALRVGDFAQFDDVDASNGSPRSFVSYGTWSLAFERDGIDQNSFDGADEGFDGIDSPGASGAGGNGVDDYFERETRPPYNVPLSGIEVKIRAIEYGTQQVRQVSVVGDFSTEQRLHAIRLRGPWRLRADDDREVAVKLPISAHRLLADLPGADFVLLERAFNRPSGLEDAITVNVVAESPWSVEAMSLNAQRIDGNTDLSGLLEPTNQLSVKLRVDRSCHDESVLDVRLEIEEAS